MLAPGAAKLYAGELVGDARVEQVSLEVFTNCRQYVIVCLMDKLIFDAGPLITVCKFRAGDRLIVDHISDHCQIVVAESVRVEVVAAGVRYPDAQVAQQRIDGGQIVVMSPPPSPDLEALIAPYGLGDGERDSILLAKRPGLEAGLVIDDHLAYLVSDRLKCQKRFLLDTLVDLLEAGNLNKGLAVEMVQAIRSRYPPAFVEHTLLLLQR